METINEYVNVDEKEEIPKATKSKKQKNKTKKELENVDDDDDETFKKRTALISKKEEINFSSNEIKLMTKNRINILYELHEEKLNDYFLEPSVEMIIKALSTIFIFDDDESLKKDLIENKQLRKIINRLTSGITGRFSESTVLFNIICIISKHIKSYRFNKKETNEEEEIPAHVSKSASIC